MTLPTATLEPVFYLTVFVAPAAIYFRCAPTFDVSHAALAWMTESLFVGTGARFPDRVEMRFFRVA